MQLDTNQHLPLFQRQFLAAYQAGEALDALRPPRVGNAPEPESEVIPLFKWITSQTDGSFAIAAVSACCGSITRRSTSQTLITAATSVYDSCKELEATLNPPPKVEAEQAPEPARRRGRPPKVPPANPTTWRAPDGHPPTG